MRKIAVITGTRAEYGPLKILMDAIEKDEELELMSIITGMHLLPAFGNTYKSVEKDFPKSVKIPMKLTGDGLDDMAFYLADGIKNFTSFFSKNKPDIVVIAGDRSEALAASLAALYLNIPIAHINGGDVSGGMIDESIRHSITKMAHIHLAHSRPNANRIKKMGEDPKRIFVTGTLAIESILNITLPNRERLFQKFNLNPNEMTFLVVQHPIPTLEDKGFNQMKELFLSLDELKAQTILIYPNCDAGCNKLIALIEKYKDRDYLYAFKNLDHGDYIGFMNTVDIMIGNSSSGIIEAPTLKTPVLNIGNRQSGRERSDNIINVNPDKEGILKATELILNDEDFKKKVKNCKNKFGEGDASKKIVDVLKNIEINSQLLQKQITY